MPEIEIQIVQLPRLSLLVGKKLLEGIPDITALMNLLEAVLYGLFLEQAQSNIVLHAAGVSRGEHALILAGPSKAGKSTLALALLQRGLCYLSEEWIVLDKAHQARGLARVLHLDEVPAWEHRCEPISTPPQKEHPRSQLLLPPQEQVEHRALPPVAIVILARQRHHLPRLTRIVRHSVALGALQSSLISSGQDPLSDLTSLVENIPLYRLTFSEPHETAQLLETRLLDDYT